MKIFNMKKVIYVYLNNFGIILGRYGFNCFFEWVVMDENLNVVFLEEKKNKNIEF